MCKGTERLMKSHPPSSPSSPDSPTPVPDGWYCVNVKCDGHPWQTPQSGWLTNCEVCGQPKGHTGSGSDKFKDEVCGQPKGHTESGSDEFKDGKRHGQGKSTCFWQRFSELKVEPESEMKTVKRLVKYSNKKYELIDQKSEEIRPADHWTHFNQAIQRGKEMSCIDGHDENGNTALAAAVNRNVFDKPIFEEIRIPLVAKQLIDVGGASVDEPTGKGTHLLEIAMKTKHGDGDGADMFRFLLARDAKPPKNIKKLINEAAKGNPEYKRILEYWHRRAKEIPVPNEKELRRLKEKKTSSLERDESLDDREQ